MLCYTMHFLNIIYSFILFNINNHVFLYIKKLIKTKLHDMPTTNIIIIELSFSLTFILNSTLIISIVSINQSVHDKIGYAMYSFLVLMAIY